MIVIEHLAGFATIQDLGRPGFMHEGLAPGGALVPELLVAANRSVGNVDGAPAIELFGRMIVRWQMRGTVAFGDRVIEAGEGGRNQFESGKQRVIYFAVHGGIAAPLICGGRGTQLSAGIGAPLRAGDRLTVDRIHGQVLRAASDRLAVDDRPIRVVPGPDLVPGALEALLDGRFQISPASDRVGTRFDGPALPAPGGSGVSRPMVRGAIELPPDGHPIVLGPEHPTTGGYPVIGVVAAADQGQLFARPIGAKLRFTTA